MIRQNALCVTGRWEELSVSNVGRLGHSTESVATEAVRLTLQRTLPLKMGAGVIAPTRFAIGYRETDRRPGTRLTSCAGPHSVVCQPVVLVADEAATRRFVLNRSRVLVLFSWYVQRAS